MIECASPSGITRASLLGILLGVELRRALAVVEELASDRSLPARLAAELDQLRHVLADWTAKTAELTYDLEAGR